jgi:methylenetetrahydrofolate reductase (NADPH)
MKITDHLMNATKPLISFEIIPPKRGGDFYNLEKVILDLAQYNPPFIDITSHASKRHSEMRKRPGTLGICAVIQHKYGVDAVPHVLCEGFSKEETEDFLIDLNYLGVENVLAVRGDSSEKKVLLEGKSRNEYAVDLVQQITAMNNGKYLDSLNCEKSNFCVGVAGYPEIHSEAKSLNEDIFYLKQKIATGAEYVVTQMFFDNEKYFKFVDECRKQDVNVPIIPGLKILTTYNHLKMLPNFFSINLPQNLVNEVKANKEYVKDIGIEWAITQAKELIAAKVPAVHFFVMNNSKNIQKVIESL